MYMSYEQIKAALENVTYKTGWNITVLEHAFEGVWLRIEARVENSYQPGSMVDLGINCPVPGILSNEEQFYDWLLYRLCRVETHECREWFKLNGKAYKDPHQDIDEQLYQR